MLLIFSWLVICSQFVNCQIKCYHFENKTVSDGGIHNDTIKCSYPADHCYTVWTSDGRIVKGSCVWEGHCLKSLLCWNNCHLYCCTEELCNRAQNMPLSKVVVLLCTLIGWFFGLINC